MADVESSRTDTNDDVSIDLSLLRELGKNSLINALNSVRSIISFEVAVPYLLFLQVNGVKTLVLDPSVAGPLGLLTEVSILKARPTCDLMIRQLSPFFSTTV